MAIKETIDLNVTGFISALDKARAEVLKTGDAIKGSLEKSVKFNVDSSSLKGMEADAKTTAKHITDTFADAGDKAGASFSKSLGSNFSTGIKSAFKDGQDAANQGGGLFAGLAGSLGQLATPAGAATAAIGGVTAAIMATANIGQEFETSLQSVSSVTGLTGNQLTVLGDKARDLALKFGGDATTQLASFQGVLSRFGADLAKSPDQLAKVADNINILAKAGGLDASQAMDTLTNSMLQFGVNVSDPNEAAAQSTRYINALAQSAVVGAAEIPQVGEAILVAGVAAKSANVSFEETNAAIQVLAAGGKVGAEAGTALRNVLGKIAGEEVIPAEALAKLKSLGVDMTKVSNTAIPLSERLVELGKASKDATAFAQVFGMENAAAATILASGAGTIKDWTAKITGSNAATEAAAKNMNTLAERVNRAKAQVSDFAIGTFMAVVPALNSTMDIATSVIQTAFEGWWLYFKNAFIAPLEGVWTTLVGVFNPLVDLFKELFGNAGDQATTFKDVMEGVGKVLGFIFTTVLTPVRMGFQALGTVIGWVVDYVKLVKHNFEQAYNSSALFRNIISGVGDAFKAVGSWIGVAIDYVNKFFSSIGKKPQAPFDKTKDSAKEAAKNVSELNKQLDANSKVPAATTVPIKTDAKGKQDAEKAAEELANYLLSAQGRIAKGQTEIDKIRTSDMINELKLRRKAVEEDVNLSAQQKSNELLAIDLKVIEIEKEAKLKALSETFAAEQAQAKTNAEKFITDKKLQGNAVVKVNEALNTELQQMTVEFELSRTALVNDSENKIKELRQKNYAETQALLAQQAIANALLIKEQQKQSLDEQKSSLTSYVQFMADMQSSSQTIAEQLAASFAQKRPTLAQDDTLAKETKELSKQLTARDLTYAAYVDSVRGRQQQLSSEIQTSWYDSLGVIQGISAALGEEFKRYTDAAKERLDISTKERKQNTKGEYEWVTKQYENITQLLEDTGQSAMDVLAGTFATALVQGQDAGKALAVIFLDILQSLVPVFSGMIFGVIMSSPLNIATAGLGGLAIYAGIMGTLTALVQGAKAAIGGAWEGFMPGVQSVGAKKHPKDNTLAWISNTEAILPESMTKREDKLLTYLFNNKGKTSQDYFMEKIMPSMNLAMPVVNVAGGGSSSADNLLREIARNTSRKSSGRMAIEHEFAPLKVKGTDLVAEYKKSLAKEMRRV